MSCFKRSQFTSAIHLQYRLYHLENGVCSYLTIRIVTFFFFFLHHDNRPI